MNLFQFFDQINNELEHWRLVHMNLGLVELLSFHNMKHHSTVDTTKKWLK
jgi:hypothetical protein